MNEIAETARLRLREFGRDDLEELAEMFRDPEQMRYYPRPRSTHETAEWLARNEAFYAEHGYGFWRIEELETSSFLGYCGIRPFVFDGRPATEIGWHTKKSSWNRGIATEAAKAVCDLAFTKHSQSRLVALVPPDHAASRRVAEKIGMRETDSAVHDGFEYATYVCERGR